MGRGASPQIEPCDGSTVMCLDVPNIVSRWDCQELEVLTVKLIIGLQFKFDNFANIQSIVEEKMKTKDSHIKEQIFSLSYISTFI